MHGLAAIHDAMVVAEGHTLNLVAVITGDRSLERRLKQQKNAPRIVRNCARSRPVTLGRAHPAYL